MKANYLLLTALVVCLFSACKNADDFQDVVYFTGTETSPVSKFTVDGPAEMALTVSASCKAEQNIKIQIKTDPEKVESYNQSTGKVYKMLPTGSYELSGSELTIEAGKTASTPLKISLLSVDDFEEGVIYCLPVSIISTDGLPVLEASRTVYVVFNQVIITKAASLASNYFVVPFSKDESLKSVPNVSMEARVYVDKFQGSNPYISTVMGIEENFLLRFGDVNIDPNQVQLAGGGFQVTGTTQFETKKWYHLAVVYDGTEIKLYINGALNGSIAAPRGNINLTDSYSGGFHIGRSVNSRYLNGAISEVRVWTKALSANEILNNMCYVDPTSSGLLAYWRMNEGEGQKVKDWSGHGWDITAGRNITWMEGVRCPE